MREGGEGEREGQKGKKGVKIEGRKLHTMPAMGDGKHGKCVSV